MLNFDVAVFLMKICIVEIIIRKMADYKGKLYTQSVYPKKKLYYCKAKISFAIKRY